jgi:beta-mannosidase
LDDILTGAFWALRICLIADTVIDKPCRPEPFKFIHFPPVEELNLKATVDADGESVILATSKPIKGIVLDVEGEDVKWSDQAIDLVPDDPQTIKAVGLNGRAIKLRYLGDGAA